MTQDRLDQLGKVEDTEATLRDDMQEDSGPIELSASDLVAIDPEESDPETTQVIERSRIEGKLGVDATTENLRQTMQSDPVNEMTAERNIPDELIDRSQRTRERRRLELRDPSDSEIGMKTLKFEPIEGPKTEKMQAVGTQTLPPVDDPDATAVRSIDSGTWAELDDDGFYAFVVRPDAEGRITLPSAVFGDGDPADRAMIYVRCKNLSDNFSGE